MDKNLNNIKIFENALATLCLKNHIAFYIIENKEEFHVLTIKSKAVGSHFLESLSKLCATIDLWFIVEGAQHGFLIYTFYNDKD